MLKVRFHDVNTRSREYRQSDGYGSREMVAGCTTDELVLDKVSIDTINYSEIS